MYDQLVQFHKKYGHGNVPYTWPENKKTANWVFTQRHKYKNGLLTQQKTNRLEALGVIWYQWSNLLETKLAELN